MKIKYLKKPINSQLRDYIYEKLASNTPISIVEIQREFEVNPKTNKPYSRDAIYYHIERYYKEKGGEA